MSVGRWVEGASEEGGYVLRVARNQLPKKISTTKAPTHPGRSQCSATVSEWRHARGGLLGTLEFNPPGSVVPRRIQKKAAARRKRECCPAVVCYR